MSDIFISYAREDVARVEPLAKALELEDWSSFAQKVEDYALILHYLCING